MSILKEKPKVAISFRFKLMAVMLGLIAAITGSMLYLTQQAISKNYQQFLDSQFSQQVGQFVEQQRQRLQTTADAIAAATESVRLIAALEAGDASRFYSDMAFQLDTVLAQYRGNLSNDSMGYFFRFIGKDGIALPTNEVSAGSVSGLSEQELDAILEQLSDRKQGILQTARAGYIDFKTKEGRILYELLITPIVDIFGEGALGELVFGIQVNERSELRSDELLSGLYLNGELFSSSIPASLKDSIESGLSATLSQKVLRVIRMKVNEQPYQVFYHRLQQHSSFPEVYQVSLLPLTDLERLRAGVRDVIYILSIGALLIAIILSFIFAGRLTTRIQGLLKGTIAVREGDFTYRIKPEGGDEIALLAESFNEMSEGLALKEKYRDIISKVSDKRVADAILQGDLKLELGGENKDVTVMFCDVRGFTKLSATMPPGEVIEMLNEHMTAMTKVIYQYKGTVDKFIGDAIMVIFGAPQGYNDDARNACAAAIAMIEERERLNQEGRYKIKIGIGLASGLVVAGNMGAVDRLNYTVLGKQVNLSARLCSVAGQQEAVICTETAARVGNAYELRPTGKLNLKGFAESVEAYYLPVGKNLQNETGNMGIIN